MFKHEHIDCFNRQELCNCRGNENKPYENSCNNSYCSLVVHLYLLLHIDATNRSATSGSCLFGQIYYIDLRAVSAPIAHRCLCSVFVCADAIVSIATRVQSKRKSTCNRKINQSFHIKNNYPIKQNIGNVPSGTTPHV